MKRKLEIMQRWKRGMEELNTMKIKSIHLNKIKIEKLELDF
jgi:hypothetical protein